MQNYRNRGALAADSMSGLRTKKGNLFFYLFLKTR